MAVDSTKERPEQPPFVWFPPLVLSTSAYLVSVLRPPTLRLATRDKLNISTSIRSLSNFRSDALKRALADTHMISKCALSSD
jgi:hypothetical protein